MSLISRSDERRLRRFWRKMLEPAAAQMRARGVQFLGDAGQHEEESWYVSVDRTEAALIEIESGDVARSLTILWRDQGLPELAAIGPAIAKLASALSADDGGNEVSSEVYAMY